MLLLTISDDHAAQVAQATRDFLKPQERFHETAKRSTLPTLILSTDDRDWNRCARAILDYR